MRLSENFINKLSKFIFKKLQENNQIEPLVNVEKIIQKINEVISKNMQEESAIDRAVEKMMDQYQSQIKSGEMDERKLQLMIKKQIAKERKFIL